MNTQEYIHGDRRRHEIRSQLSFPQNRASYHYKTDAEVVAIQFSRFNCRFIAILSTDAWEVPRRDLQHGFHKHSSYGGNSEAGFLHKQKVDRDEKNLR